MALSQANGSMGEETKGFRIAVDVMGGDHAPKEILLGCLQAASLLGANDVLFLVGDEKQILQLMPECGALAGLKVGGLDDPALGGKYKIVHASEVIGMDEAPVDAVRHKLDSSINVMNKLAADGGADAVISAGNTGACVAASQVRLRTIPGVSRPGIAVAMPTFHGPVVMCDMGANVSPKARHFLYYGLMGSTFARTMGIQNPRVGLMSIGEEESKGTTLVKESNQLLKSEPQINFIGNVEGKDVFRGVCDVVVCDGFTGNVVLKTAEGMAEGLMKSIIAEAQKQPADVAKLVGGIVKKVYGRFDWQEYGGAPLLGIGGISLIAHGRSQARAIYNCVRVAKELLHAEVNKTIAQQVAAAVAGGEG